MAHRIFVYGTLMRGEWNHHRLGAKMSRFVGVATTKPEFHFMCLGFFPALLPKGATAVVGEVYEVPDEVLASLDRLEGHPHFYRRTAITLGDGTLAETYILNDAQWNMKPIYGGDWRAYATERNLR